MVLQGVDALGQPGSKMAGPSCQAQRGQAQVGAQRQGQDGLDELAAARMREGVVLEDLVALVPQQVQLLNIADPKK